MIRYPTAGHSAQARRRWSTPEDQRPAPHCALPDRAAVFAATAEALSASGRRWAWQGPAGAPERWLAETGLKDLDVWYEGDCRDQDCPADILRRQLGCALIAQAHDPRRLRHVSLAVPTSCGLAVVDITCGDLRVGPILLVPAGEVTTDPITHRLNGPAAAADLLVRPVLRGRLPDSTRLAQARSAWAATPAAGRDRLRVRLSSQLGSRAAGELCRVLDGSVPGRRLPRRTRTRLVLRSLALPNLAATWAQRRTIVPAGRRAGPFGVPVRGVVVALVGTDGAGKSTVAEGLRERLRGYGLRTASAYFGMARGNLPGVGLARRLLGMSRGKRRAEQVPEGRPADPAAVDARTDHPYLRRAAAWYYAAEYGWRYLSAVRPQRLRRRVVIVDRWVYDLRESPWPGSPAARVAERLIPKPDVLVLPDAPIELIHGRKPERPLAEQAAQQERFRRLLAEHPARRTEVVVNTAGGAGDPLVELVAAVVEAAHADRRGRR